MEVVMPTWLYLSVALVFVVALYYAKLKLWNPTMVSNPMDKEEFMMNLVVWIGLIYMALVWPASIILVALYGLGRLGFVVYSKVKR